MKRYVLDACALIAYLNDEAGSDVIDALFSGDAELFMSVVQNYRNISSHHSAVSMKQYAEFKEKLLQSGLLGKFIDAFAEPGRC